jgi:5'-deoxynucleotidase YfbR-like HD superfamily hydrolase
MLLADELIAHGVKVNTESMLRMALLHDWAETRVGDMPRTATEYFGAIARKRAETSAFQDIVEGFSNEDFYRKLHDDYEQRGSLEARLVKAADVIDLLIQALALERAGVTGLDEFWQVAQKPDFQLEGIAQGVVNNLLQSILDARSDGTA